MLYMQLISAVRCHRFKGGGGSYSTATDSEETNLYLYYIIISKSSVNAKYLFKGPQKF